MAVRRRHVLSFALLATWCTLIALIGTFDACTCAAPPGSQKRDGGVDVVDGGSCHVDDDCALGEQCTNGTCVAAIANGVDSGCKSDNDCGAGTLCATSTGKCVDQAATPGV